ncbi:hypothetical protein [Nonomuraea zeae]|uniref:Bulb-type lectin domain-containing protein n=1 Tax=Nonomuraea zeae TaxID=1642303 RepID=A0A5S4FLL0_9ACTN|nr:hypothetical protein [Nonomuraea zeae]TMR21533.1 hypothetical protein ETD85_50735 [Nonomuraea zeae]
MPRFRQVARISAAAPLIVTALAVATPPAHAVLPAASAAVAYDAKCQFRTRTQVGNNWHIKEGGGNLLRGEVCQIGNAQLIMQTDGNLVLYNNGRAVFATGTTETWTQPPAYKAEFQTDGNFVVYNYNPPTARWASNTWSTCGGSAACELVIQSDGNVVIYNGNQVVWDAW